MKHLYNIMVFNWRCMYSMLLPADGEGRFAFEKNHMFTGAGLYFHFQNGSKRAVFEGEGNFETAEGSAIFCKNIKFETDRLYNVIISGEQFSMYAEELDSFICAKSYYVAQNTDIKIGRNADCDILYDDDTVSHEHATIRREISRWVLAVHPDSKNGTFINEKNVNGVHELFLGDVIRIMGLSIIIGKGFIAITNNKKITLSAKLILLSWISHLPYAIPQKQTDTFFDRSPRIQYSLTPEPIDIDMPPVKIGGSRLPLMLRLGNPILYGGRAIATGNIFMAVSSMVMPALTQGLTEKERKEYERLRKEKYREYLKFKAAEIDNELSYERDYMTNFYQPVSEMMLYPVNNKLRLWERSRRDSDFLKVRVGIGDIPMVAELNYPKKKFELEPDELVEEMYRLAGKRTKLTDAPVMLSLTEDYIVSIYGADQEERLNMVNNLISQIAVTHAYDEVKLIILCDKKERSFLDYARFLRHNRDDDSSIRFFASSQSDVLQLSKYFSNEWDYLTADKGSSYKKDAHKDKPAYVVFATSKTLFDSFELLKPVLRSEEYAGISIVTAFDNSNLRECKKILDLHDHQTAGNETHKKKRMIDLVHPDAVFLPFEPDQVSTMSRVQSMRALYPIRLKESKKGGASLPKSVSFLDMFGANDIEKLDPEVRWNASNPVKSLEAPVGVGTDGKPFMLDLHEKQQGPHGLIAGGTGSGKSEFIITYILSMAVNYSPEEVAFILIDYKGGGLADAFENPDMGIHLPHVVGTVTNLDGASIQRSLKSIKSELNRRQELFRQVKEQTGESTIDIYEYQRLYRNKIISEPLPHLLIISDEFAELKKQQPEFMDDLVSTARIGRSLGVHLILATQRPTGVVNDQVWSNTKFRVCLRVAEKSDSMEMLRRPEAAEIKNVGRFYLQVGYNEMFAMGQAAWCGAAYAPEANKVSEEESTVDFIDTTGQVFLQAKAPQKQVVQTGKKQLAAVVEYLSQLAKRTHVRTRRLWTDPLSAKTDMTETLALLPRTLERVTAVPAMIDDPEHQTQYPYQLDLQSVRHMLVCGVGESGKSTFVSSLLFSTVIRYSQEDFGYYLLDMAGGALAPYAGLPHCGAYLKADDEQSFVRLLELLKKTAANRKKLFEQAEVTDYNDYKKVAKQKGMPVQPLILFVIAGYAGIQNYKKGADYHSSLSGYMKECASCGIVFLITCDHLNEIHSRTRQEIDCRIALQAKDKYEYADILGVKCSFTVPAMPGRGICVIGEKPMEFQTALTFAGAEDVERNTKYKVLLNDAAKRYGSVKVIETLPEDDPNETYEHFCTMFEPGRIPLGYSLADLKPVAVPLRQLDCMSLYFGNPAGIKPVFTNLAYASAKNNMQLWIVKKGNGSVLEKLNFDKLGTKPILFDANAEGLKACWDHLEQEISIRMEMIKEWAIETGLEMSKENRKALFEYLYARIPSILIIFESISGIAQLEKDDATSRYCASIANLFDVPKIYNIYFAGGFYPETTIQSDIFSLAFRKSQFCLLFGGKYNMQKVAEQAPLEISRTDSVLKQYDRFAMKYLGNYYPMRMPCGAIEETTDPDEKSII